MERAGPQRFRTWAFEPDQPVLNPRMAEASSVLSPGPPHLSEAAKVAEDVPSTACSAGRQGRVAGVADCLIRKGRWQRASLSLGKTTDLVMAASQHGSMWLENPRPRWRVSEFTATAWLGPFGTQNLVPHHPRPGVSQLFLRRARELIFGALWAMPALSQHH